MRVERVVLVEKWSIDRILEAIDGRLDFETNLDCSIINVADTGTVDTSFTVNHNLGRLPKWYLWNIDRGGVVYDFARASWTTTQMTLKCTQANAVLKLVIF